MGTAACRRSRQPFHKNLAVISRALLDGYKEVMLVFEPIIKTLVSNHLYCLNVHSTPACQFVPDDLGRREIDRWWWDFVDLTLRSVDRSKVLIFRGTE